VDLLYHTSQDTRLAQGAGWRHFAYPAPRASVARNWSHQQGKLLPVSADTEDAFINRQRKWREKRGWDFICWCCIPPTFFKSKENPITLLLFSSYRAHAFQHKALLACREAGRSSQYLGAEGAGTVSSAAVGSQQGPGVEGAVHFHLVLSSCSQVL